jgi:hypothetical protein
MATSSYMTGRRSYARPQAALWSNNPGTLVGGLYIPTGLEVGQDPGLETNSSVLDQFLILSDHNRGEIKVTPNRIEKRERMINGHMRSYHIADKLNFDISWNMLPSRSFRTRPDFNPTTGKSTSTGVSGRPTGADEQYTVDGGAGAGELLEWYENHKGSFWMFLAYDKYNNFGNDDAAYGHLAQYNQIVEVYISKFDYSVVSRGASNHDLWNVSVSLEEV